MILAARLETILVVSWQRIWLPFALVLPDVNLRKSFGLMSLAEEISRQPDMNRVMWLLVITAVQIGNEKEQAGQNIQTI